MITTIKSIIYYDKFNKILYKCFNDGDNQSHSEIIRYYSKYNIVELYINSKLIDILIFNSVTGSQIN